MFATECGTYGEVIFEGKLVERTPVRDLARRRRARTVLSSRVGIRTVDCLPASLGSRRWVSVRMDCGDGWRSCCAGAGVACVGNARWVKRLVSSTNRCIVIVRLVSSVECLTLLLAEQCNSCLNAHMERNEYETRRRKTLSYQIWNTQVAPLSWTCERDRISVLDTSLQPVNERQRSCMVRHGVSNVAHRVQSSLSATKLGSRTRPPM